MDPDELWHDCDQPSSAKFIKYIVQYTFVYLQVNRVFLRSLGYLPDQVGPTPLWVLVDQSRQQVPVINSKLKNTKTSRVTIVVILQNVIQIVPHLQPSNMKNHIKQSHHYC